MKQITFTIDAADKGIAHDMCKAQIMYLLDAYNINKIWDINLLLSSLKDKLQDSVIVTKENIDYDALCNGLNEEEVCQSVVVKDDSQQSVIPQG